MIESIKKSFASMLGGGSASTVGRESTKAIEESKSLAQIVIFEEIDNKSNQNLMKGGS